MATWTANAAEPAFDKIFAGKKGCFLQRDLATGKVLREYGGALCKERRSPDSTFKVALALMGFETTAIKDGNTVLKWDKKKRAIDTWNRDTNARDWLKNSVVWYSQRLTPMLGMASIQRYLKDFQYGNMDFTGGITEAWLDSSLKISPWEQTEFLRKLKQRKLPLGAHAVDETLSILPVETKRGDLELAGKTGSGMIDENPKDKNAAVYRHGWYVGYFKQGNATSVFALHFEAPSERGKMVFSGLEAREMTKTILGAI